MNGQRQATTSNEEILMKLDLISEILVQNLRNIGGHLQDLSNRVQKLEEKKCPHCENRKNHTDDESRQMTIRKTYSPPPKPKGPTKSPYADENFERSHNTGNAIENEDDDEVRQITSRRTYSPRPKPRNATKTPVFFEDSEISHSLEKTTENNSYEAEKVRERAKSRLAARLGRTENDEVEPKLQMRTTRGKSPFAPRPKTKQQEEDYRLQFDFRCYSAYSFAHSPRVYEFLTDKWKVTMSFSQENLQIICAGKKDDVIRCIDNLYFLMGEPGKQFYRYVDSLSDDLSKELEQWSKEDIVLFAVKNYTYVEMRRGVAHLQSFDYLAMENAKAILRRTYPFCKI